MLVSEAIEMYGAANISTTKLIKAMQEDMPASKREKILLKACSEIARRILSKQKINCTCPEDLANYLMPQMSGLDHEELWCICVNTRNQIICAKAIFVGNLTNSPANPREIFNYAITNNAAAIMVAHNHPSGHPAPSKHDDEFTQNLVTIGKMMNIPVLDSIIIGHNIYYSYQEEGKL